MSRPVTRSQTAARRAAEATEAARIRQEQESIEAIAAEEIREANSAFRRTSATDVLAYHRQSARAAFLRNRRPIALTSQLLNYIDSIRNLPQNALVQPSTSRRRSSRAPSRAQITRLRTIANTRRIMEERVSSIYEVSQELYRFLNINQMLYLARNSLTQSYYYRKLELTYVIPTIDKFNELCQNIIINIPSDVNISRMQTRFDIDYYTQIINYLQEIDQQLLLVSNEREIKRAIVNDTEHNINNEKEMINDLLNHMRQQQLDETIDDQAIQREIQQFITKLEQRKRDLEPITKKKLQDYFSTSRFKKSREYSIYVLKSIRTLCKIYLFSIIKLNVIQAHLTSRRSGETSQQRATRNRHYSETISILYGANVNFTFILNTPITNLEELQLNIVTQSSLLDDIRRSIRVEDIRRYHDHINRNSRLQRSPGHSFSQSPEDDRDNRINYNRIQDELFEPIRDTDLSARYTRQDIQQQIQQHRRRDIEMARQVRRAERARLEEMRVAARNARIQAQQAARAARDAERAARASARASSGRQPRRTRRARQQSQQPQQQQQPQQLQPITNFDDLMEIDNTIEPEFNNKYVDPINSIYKDDPNSLIFKLKNKVISYSKDFKTNATRQLLFNSFKTKFEKSFDLNTTAPPSIENYVGNSIASLFARFIFNGKHHINFGDLGKYFVVNFTLEKNDNPTRSDPAEYRIIRQPGIDAGGLRRDFITALTSELFEKKIFISREGTKKYFLNPYFEVDEEFKFIVNSKTGYIFDDETSQVFLKDFYRFIGLLLSFILVNDCGIEHHLSSYLMANFYKTDQSEFDDYDYLYFMFMDFPEYSKSLFNLMADPDTIEYIGTEYNDYYQLTNNESNITVDKENIEEYLLLTSKYMMTKTILRKDIEIPKIHLEIQKIIDKTRQEATGATEAEIQRLCIEAEKKYIASSDVAKYVKASRDYARRNSPEVSPAELTNIGKSAEYEYVIQKSEYMTECLIEGIPDFIKEYFKGPPLYTLKSLNHYLVTPSMSNAIIEKLIRNFTNTMNKKNRLKVGSDKTKHELLTRLFISHILTKKPETAEEDFFKFIDKLLRFWSGSSFYKDNEEYKIQINTGLSNTHLPQSHTCFFLIDLPLYQGSNDDEIGELLYNKLENAVSNVGGGMGFAGGNCRRN
jgi:hypothetical protein